MTTTQTVLQGKDTATQGELYMSFELGDKSWKLTIERRPARPEPVQRRRRRHGRGAGLHVQGASALWPERRGQGALLLRGRPRRLVAAPLADRARHRQHRGRRREHRSEPARQACQDRPARWRQAAGDAAAPPRRRACLVGAARADARGRRRAPHAPRTGAADARAHRAHQPHQLAAGAAQPASAHHHRRARLGWLVGKPTASRCRRQLRAELERESARLALVKQQIKALEAARRQALEDGKQPLVAQLAQLRAIGPKGAWVLVKELFGWRRFANRRELAGCLGLAPTPYDSGGSQVEQGISKAGNKRARALLVELVVGLAAIAARQRPDPVVQPALRRRRQAHAAHRHRGPGAAPGDRAVALPAARRDPGRGHAQASRRLKTQPARCTAWHGIASS